MSLMFDITEPHPLSNTGGIGQKVGDVVLLINSPETQNVMTNCNQTHRT